MLKRLLPLIILCALALPVSAQSTFTQGMYEFDTCGGNCTTSGSWVVQDNGAQEFLVSNGAVTDYVEFSVSGKHLVIFRYTGPGITTMDVCINSSCTNIPNANAAVVVQPYIVTLTGGTDTIRIVRNFVYLDYFMVLNERPAATATILPSSTPAPSSTPQPTWTTAPSSTPQPTWTLAPSITPQPTATPMTGGGGSDPASVYATVESGQMTRFDYVATAGSVHIANLLTALFFSIWAMFLLGVLVLWSGE
jgi:hypothetical protein